MRVFCGLLGKNVKNPRFSSFFSKMAVENSHFFRTAFYDIVIDHYLVILIIIFSFFRLTDTEWRTKAAIWSKMSRAKGTALKTIHLLTLKSPNNTVNSSLVVSHSAPRTTASANSTTNGVPSLTLLLWGIPWPKNREDLDLFHIPQEQR